MNHYVLLVPGTDNIDANLNIFLLSKKQIICPCSNFISKRQSKTVKFLSKGFEKSVCLNEYKTKLENKDTANKCSHYRQKYVEMEWEQ